MMGMEWYQIIMVVAFALAVTWALIWLFLIIDERAKNRKKREKAFEQLDLITSKILRANGALYEKEEMPGFMLIEKCNAMLDCIREKLTEEGLPEYLGHITVERIDSPDSTPSYWYQHVIEKLDGIKQPLNIALHKLDTEKESMLYYQKLRVQVADMLADITMMEYKLYSYMGRKISMAHMLLKDGEAWDEGWRKVERAVLGEPMVKEIKKP